MSAPQVCPHCRLAVETTPPPAACPRCGKPLGGPGSGGTAWYYAHNKQRKGPVALDQLRALAAAGEIQPATMLLEVGSSRWMAASGVPGLFPAPAVVSPPPVAPAVPSPGPQGQDADEQPGLARPRSRGRRKQQSERLASCRAALRDLTLGAVREARRRVKSSGMRRDLAGLRAQLNERLPGEVGSHLLSEGVALPGGEELVEQHRSLSRVFSLASQAALAGDRGRKKEARDIACKLQATYVDYGRRALAQPAPFPGRQQYEERQQQLAERIRDTEAEQARLDAQWQAVPPASRRWVMAGWGLAAIVPLLLLGVVVRGVFRPAPPPEKPAGLVQADAPELAQEKAEAVLVAAEGRVWTIEGELLREAQALLESSEARQQLDTGEMTGPDREKRLRAFLRGRRSRASREKARSFVASLDAGSREKLAQAAEGLDMKPEDYVLEWLTYEGALTLGMLTRTWQDQDSLKQEAGPLLRTVFEGMSEPPAASKGVEVRRADNRIDVSLFGAHVTEEIAGDRPPSLDGDQVVLWWKSSYGDLRQLVQGDSSAGLSKKTIRAEQGRYALDYQDRLDAYRSAGQKQQWAVSLYDEALPTLVEAAGGTRGAAPHKTLQQHFARLAPSVPIVQSGSNSFGTGFLVKQRGKYLVVTNRHVIENAPDGVTVRFLKNQAGSEEETLTIPARSTTVVAIHRKADLALVDVSADAARIRSWGIQPVTLAPRRYTPPVGAHVFAIGHPGGGGTLLTRTLSDGIVSATGREAEDSRYLQVTVPLNPGNSGGPLFDDEGRVVGVNTFVLRKNEDRELTLEALNFALEIGYVHDLLNDPGQSLDEKEIAAALNPPTATLETSPLGADIRKMAQTWLGQGYQPYGGNVKSSVRFCQVPAHTKSVFTITLSRGGSYAVAVVSQGARELDLAMLTERGAVLAADSRRHSDPSIRFQAKAAGKHTLVVSNPTRSEALAIVAVFEK